MKPIYKNGEIVDFSDEGEGMSQMNDAADIHYALKRLSKRQREVVELILEGYNEVEIAEELGVSQQAISQILKRARCMLGNHMVKLYNGGQTPKETTL